jgi:hypothetical protein
MNGFCKIRRFYIGGSGVEEDNLRMLDYIIEKTIGLVREERGIRRMKNSIAKRIDVENSKIGIKLKSRGSKVADFSNITSEDYIELDVMGDLQDATVELTKNLSKYINDNKENIRKYSQEKGVEENTND